MSTGTGPSAVVVSGATGALGSAIVADLSTRNVPVIAIARSTKALIGLGEQFSNVQLLACDLSMEAPDFRNTRISAVVHAAGANFGGGVHDVDYGAILSGIELKVNGLLRLVRSAEGLLEDGGRIIALGGNLGLDPVPGATVPGVVNAALANLIRQLNRAYASRGISSHLIAPGPVDTERLRQRAADEARHEGSTPTDVFGRYASSSPFSRLTTPAEIAWAVKLLLEPEAVALAGSTLLLDSGLRTSIF